MAFIHNLEHFQSGIFAILSLRAWNAWWLLQSAAGGGDFVADDVPFLGPLTLRMVGYVVTALVSLIVAIAILRDPRPRTLVIGLAAATLVAFCFLTAMHERYSYGALVFLMLLVPWIELRWLGLAFAIVFTLNLLAAVPPTPGIAAVVSINGWMGVAGSMAMLAIMAALLIGVGRPQDLRVEVGPGPPGL